MTRSRSLIAVLTIVGASALPACAADSSADNASDPSADALTQSVAFSDEASLAHLTVEGRAVDRVPTSRDLKTQLDALAQASPSFGFDAYATRLSVADANAIAADQKHLVHFLDEADGTSPSDAAAITDITVTPVTRGQAFAVYMSKMYFEAQDVDAKAAFEKSLRVVLKSLLAKQTTAVYEISYCPDWCDEYLVAVTSTGEIRTVVAHGDN